MIIAALSASALSQAAQPKTTALPAGIIDWSGEDSDKLLNNDVIKTRLKKLLRSAGYASFMESFETLTPISKYDDFLFASGCLIHACTHLESAIAIDVKNNIIHAAIFNDENPTSYFNERGSKTPRSIVDWAKNLDDIKTNK